MTVHRSDSGVRQVTWPPFSLLIGLRRRDRVLTATGDTQFAQGDRLTLLVRAEHADQITEHRHDGRQQTLTHQPNHRNVNKLMARL